MARSLRCRTFDHLAVVHRSTDELVSALLPFVAEGLRAGQPVLVNLAAERTGALAEALGPDAAGVRWTDAERWETHPGHRLRAIGEALDEQVASGASWLRFVGECPWLSTPAEMVPEWTRFDAALNEVLAGAPLTMVCAYDAAALPRAVLDGAMTTHPCVGLVPRSPSASYVEPGRFLEGQQGPLVVPPTAARVAGRVTPGTARRFLEHCLGEQGVTGERAGDLLVVLSEVVTNAWQAGAASVTVSSWSTGRGVALQVDDDGPGLWDALAGYRRPPVDADSGRGLWITRQLADVVDIAPTPTGTSVRVQMLDPAAVAV